MKTLVVCLDGTNQTKTQDHPTNIARIFDSLGGNPVEAGDGSLETTVICDRTVVGKYLPGVGTQGDLALKILGNLFGDGIAEPIVRGYTFLSRNYEAGDDIVITGFSRGATAARALAGFAVGQGLLDPGGYDVTDKNAAYLRAVAAWYAYRKQKPNFASQARMFAIEGLLGKGLPTLGPGDFTRSTPIKAVAVFDTVSSLGVPRFGSDGIPKFDFSICDTALNPAVEYGFHALAADEMRDLFSPTYWTARNNVIQQIFPGAHSDVGGGYPNRGLSDAALDWMLTNLEGVAVTCDRTLLMPAFAPDPMGIGQDDGATFPFRDTPRRGRAFPETAQLSDSLLARWGNEAEMLPVTTPERYQANGTWADGRRLK